MIRALVFDFDGLIADTEGPEFQAWRETWAHHGVELSVEEWGDCIGTVDAFDPVAELSRRTDQPLDALAVNEYRRAIHRPLIAALDPLPGVLEHITDAKARGLKTAVASSSDHSWVSPLLEQFGLAEAFAHLALYDGSCPAKPAPDLYLRACEALSVEPCDAIAYEDSANGISAAKAAGLWCVAVPHDLTRHLDLSAADLVVDSLADIALIDLLDRFGC